MRLRDKVAMISGAASGIGAACARRFVAEGARVLLADIDHERATALAAELGLAASALRLDVTREEDWSAAAARIAATFGAMTTLVDSAESRSPPRSKAKPSRVSAARWRSTSKEPSSGAGRRWRR